MADRPTPEFQPVRQYLISERQVRAAFVLSFAGMVGLLLLLLVVAMARPQARFQALTGQEFQAGLRAATARLEGYEVFEDGRARLDIDRAIELVAERGVQEPGIVPAGQAPASGAPAGDEGAEAPAVDGAAAFATCAACHQANGQGLPGVFPPLAGHAADLYAADPDYIVDVVLFGLMGQIQVDGVSYNGAMPSHAHMSDAEIAAILDHVLTSFGNEERVADFVPYEAADVAGRRAQALSPTEVYAARQELGLE